MGLSKGAAIKHFVSELHLLCFGHCGAVATRNLGGQTQRERERERERQRAEMANERSDSKESKNGVKKEAEGQSKVGKSKGKGLEIDMKKQIQRKPKEEAEKKKKEQVVVEKKKMTKRKMGDESLEMEKKKRRSTVGATENPEKKERKVKKGDMGEETAKKEKSRKKIENVSSIADDEEEAGNVSCSFPMSRVRRLMRLEGGNANVTITGIASNAVFLVNKASVITLLPCPRPILLSFSPSRSKISPSTVHGQKGYEFLSDFVPEKMRAEDALKAMASVET
ncbi:hypothetical protein ZIOFF_054030 [Zingiber officinale]|uniref:Uncharacterized protein n=1 Tax=Zingiber officinale TaxID=94328 RepID=A0A8J5KDB4_ZINOF|nr:hypothetical protein ZIOFF_054030 [Zingiber officinale]